MTNSRLLSTTGASTNFRHLCQINFSSAAYTTVTTTKCINYSNGAFNYRKSYGTGIKYDPISA